LSYEIFENECHATLAAKLIQKTFLYFIFEKECRATQADD